MNVSGDGACQFRAVSVGLWDSERHHALVRRKALEVLRAKPPEVHDCQVYVSQGLQIGTVAVGDDFDQYINALADDRSWGDHNTPGAATRAAAALLVTTHAENCDWSSSRAARAVCALWVGFHSEMPAAAAVCALQCYQSRRVTWRLAFFGTRCPLCVATYEHHLSDSETAARLRLSQCVQAANNYKRARRRPQSA